MTHNDTHPHANGIYIASNEYPLFGGRSQSEVTLFDNLSSHGCARYLGPYHEIGHAGLGVVP
jgi:hypothetical protein